MFEVKGINKDERFNFKNKLLKFLRCNGDAGFIRLHLTDIVKLGHFVSRLHKPFLNNIHY